MIDTIKKLKAELTNPKKIDLSIFNGKDVFNEPLTIDEEVEGIYYEMVYDKIISLSEKNSIKTIKEVLIEYKKSHGLA